MMTNKKIYHWFQATVKHRQGVAKEIFKNCASFEYNSSLKKQYVNAFVYSTGKCIGSSLRNYDWLFHILTHHVKSRPECWQ